MKPSIKIRINYIFMIFILGFTLSPQTSFSQLKHYSFEQVDRLQKIEKKPVIIFIHTSWCKYCGLIRNTTLKNNRVIELLNNTYYFIDFDAEDKRTIFFHNNIFKYKPTGNNTGTHQLATALGTINGSVSYPVLCILNADYEITFQYNQYLGPKDILHALED